MLDVNVQPLNLKLLIYGHGRWRRREAEEPYRGVLHQENSNNSCVLIHVIRLIVQQVASVRPNHVCHSVWVKVVRAAATVLHPAVGVYSDSVLLMGVSSRICRFQRLMRINL